MGRNCKLRASTSAIITEINFVRVIRFNCEHSLLYSLSNGKRTNHRKCPGEVTEIKCHISKGLLTDSSLKEIGLFDKKRTRLKIKNILYKI